MGDKEENTINRDFLRGVCFGFLLAGIAVLAFFLTRYTGFGGRRSNGAQILTDPVTQGKISQVERIIGSDYLYDTDSDLLETYMFRGIAAGLDDKYAGYYSPEEYADINRHNEGSYVGIGVVFMEEAETKQIIVSEVYKGSPAMEAGILEGDILTGLQGETVEGKDFEQIMDMIHAEKDGEITLTLLRDGEEITISCRMDEVLLTSVSWEMEENQIACMEIQEFDRVTIGQFEDALNEVKESGAKALILDLRDNPGGLLESVTAMLDDLLDECLLMTTVTREEHEESIYAEDGKLFDGPAVVLVNNMSASAAEVFAGVLQYYGAAFVIGAPTYGKGVVQSTYMLRDGSALKLTTEKYLIAGELDIDNTGITPDLAVEESDSAKKPAPDDLSQEDPYLEEAKAYLIRHLQ